MFISSKLVRGAVATAGAAFAILAAAPSMASLGRGGVAMGDDIRPRVAMGDDIRPRVAMGDDIRPRVAMGDDIRPRRLA